MRFVTAVAWALAVGPAAVRANNECSEGTLGRLQPMCEMPSVQHYCDRNNYRKHRRRDTALPFDLSPEEFEQASQETGIDLAQLFSKRSQQSAPALSKRGNISPHKKQHWEDGVCRCYRKRHPKTTYKPKTTGPPSTTQRPSTTTQPSTTTRPEPSTTTTSGPAPTTNVPTTQGTTTTEKPNSSSDTKIESGSSTTTSQVQQSTTAGPGPATTTGQPGQSTSTEPGSVSSTQSSNLPDTSTPSPPSTTSSQVVSSGASSQETSASPASTPDLPTTTASISLPDITTTTLQLSDTTVVSTEVPISTSITSLDGPSTTITTVELDTSTTSAETTTTSGPSILTCPVTGTDFCGPEDTSGSQLCVTSGQTYVLDCGSQYQGTILNPPLTRRRRGLLRRQRPASSFAACQDECTGDSNCVAGNYVDGTCTLFSSISCQGGPGSSVPGGLSFRKQIVLTLPTCDSTSASSASGVSSTLSTESIVTTVDSTTVVIPETTTSIDVPGSTSTTVTEPVPESTTTEGTTTTSPGSPETTTTVESTTTTDAAETSASSTTDVESASSLTSTEADTSTTDISTTSEAASSATSDATSADSTTTTATDSSSTAETTSESPTSTSDTTSADTTTTETSSMAETTSESSTSVADTTSAETTSTEASSTAESTSDATTSALDTTTDASTTATSTAAQTTQESSTLAESTTSESSTTAPDTTSTEVASTTESSTAESSSTSDSTTAESTTTLTTTMETTTTTTLTTTMETTTSETTTSAASTTTTAAPDPSSCAGTTSPYTASNGVSFTKRCQQQFAVGSPTNVFRTVSSVANFRSCMDVCSLSQPSGNTAGCVATSYSTSSQTCVLYSSLRYGVQPSTDYDSSIVSTFTEPSACSTLASPYSTLDGRQFTVECTKQYFATSDTTISRTRVGSFRGCVESCKSASGCVALTWQKSTTFCTLLNSLGVGSKFNTDYDSARTGDETTSCSSLANPYTASNGVRYNVQCGNSVNNAPGNTNRITTSGSPSPTSYRGCLDLCSTTASCVAAQFSSSVCTLYSNVDAGLTPSTTADAGVVTPLPAGTTAVSCESDTDRVTQENSKAFYKTCGRAYVVRDNAIGSPSTGVLDLDRCIQLCAYQDTCFAVNYATSGSTAGQCQLLSNIDYGSAASTTTSSASLPATCERLSQYSSGGRNFFLGCRVAFQPGTSPAGVTNLLSTTSNVPNLLRCTMSCANDARCSAATFSSNTVSAPGTCQLFTDYTYGYYYSPDTTSDGTGPITVQYALVSPQPNPPRATTSCADTPASYSYQTASYQKSCTRSWIAAAANTLPPVLSSVQDLSHCIDLCGAVANSGCVAVNYGGGSCTLLNGTQFGSQSGGSSAARLPATCNNGGVRWAYYTDSQDVDSSVDAQNAYNPTVIKTRSPTLTGITQSVGYTHDGTDFAPYGSATIVSGTNYILEHQFYLYASIGGTFSIQLSAVNDILDIWIGDTALSGWSRSNAQEAKSDLSSNDGALTFSRSLQGGTYTPVRIVYKQGTGTDSFGVTITTPDGVNYLASPGSGSSTTDLAPYIVLSACDGTTLPAFPPFGSSRAETCVRDTIARDTYNPTGLSYTIFDQNQFTDADLAAYTANYLFQQQPIYTGGPLASLSFATPNWPQGSSGVLTLSDGYSFDSSKKSVLMQGFFLAPASRTYIFVLDTDREDNWARLWLGDKAYNTWQESNADAFVNFQQPSRSRPRAVITLTQGQLLPITYLWSNSAGAGRSFFRIIDQANGASYTTGNLISSCTPALTFPGPYSRSCTAPQVRSADGNFCTYPVTPPPSDGSRAPAILPNPVVFISGRQTSADDPSPFPLQVPWQISLYGQTRSTLYVELNGWISMDQTSSNVYSNQALPSSNLPTLAFAPYWNDLVVNFNTDQGLFYQITGPVGRRQLNIEYYTTSFSQPEGITHFTVTFAETAPTQVIYTFYETNNLPPSSGFGTIGVQYASMNQSSQWSTGVRPAAGLQIIYDATTNLFTKTPSST